MTFIHVHTAALEGLGLLGQLGPVLPPVGRAQILAGDLAASGLLNQHALGDGDGPVPANPLVYEAGGFPDQPRKVRLRVGVDVLLEIHGRSLAQLNHLRKRR